MKTLLFTHLFTILLAFKNVKIVTSTDYDQLQELAVELSTTVQRLNDTLKNLRSELSICWAKIGNLYFLLI